MESSQYPFGFFELMIKVFREHKSKTIWNLCNGGLFWQWNYYQSVFPSLNSEKLKLQRVVWDLFWIMKEPILVYYSGQ